MSVSESEIQLTFNEILLDDIELAAVVDEFKTQNSDHIEENPGPDSEEDLLQEDEDVNEHSEGAVGQSRNDNSLLKQALDEKCSNEEIVTEWIAQYRKNANDALVTFVQFVIEASGSQYNIPDEFKLTSEYVDILIAGTAQFRNISIYYPMTKKDASIFMEKVAKFLKCFLMVIDATSIINDNVSLDHVTGFVMACAQSKVRPFRHTGTMMGLKMLTILIDLKGIEHEKHKALWLKMFDAIFLARYRDVVDDIRFLCIVECLTWFEKYPESFLKPESVEYIFEALRDESVKIRECSLKVLQQIYVNRDLRKVWLEQGKKFVNDLIIITLDSESELAEQAVGLLEKFSRFSIDTIEESQYLIIDQLIFAVNRGLAQAAAKLFAYRHFNDKNCSSKQQVRLLIEFFQQFGENQHAAYLVDSFFGINATILDWFTMVEMLTEEPTSLDANSISSLIEILSRGIKQAITGEIPAGRYTKNLTRNPKAGAQDAATEVLAPVMPRLLSQHGLRCGDLINLLEIPQHLNISHYQRPDNLEQLVQLLDIIEQIMFQKEDISILGMAAATLECIYQVPAAKNHQKKLLNRAVANYETSFQSWENATDKGHNHRLVITLRLLSSLCGYFDLDDWNIKDTFRSRLQMTIQDREKLCLSSEALRLHLEICYLILNWDLKRARDMSLDKKLEVKDFCITLKENLDDFFFASCNLIGNDKNIIVATDAFAFTCDLLVLFGDHLRRDSNRFIRQLQYQSTINEHELFDNFVLQNVFQDTDDEALEQLLHESHFDELQSKRRILTSYCKLVAFNLMPIMRACIIFQYFHRFFKPFGDILNSTMELGLEINAIHYGMTILHTCLLVYKKIMAAHDGVGTVAIQSTEFSELIQLAKRLAETFNSKILKNRPGVVALHRSGIMFASEVAHNSPTSAPENLSFLCVLEEFVPQLVAQDKLDILDFLARIEDPALPSCKRDEWQPLTGYRMALEMAIKKSCRRYEFYERQKRGSTQRL